MASHTTVLLSLAALVCLAALTLAAPHNFDDNGAVIFRDRRAAPRYSNFRRRGAATRNAPVIVAPESSEADEAEEVQSDEEEQEEPVAPVVPQKQFRKRPAGGKPAQDDGAPPNYANVPRGGATAIATSYSKGDGASSNSHATAYDGNFSGGQFRHRYQG